jgi:hypothetical protein
MRAAAWGVCVCASTWSGYWLVRCWWLRATEASFVVGCSAGLAPPEQPAPHAFLRLVPSWSELILPPFSPISLWVTRKIFRSGVFAATDFQGIWYVFVFESWGLLEFELDSAAVVDGHWSCLLSCRAIRGWLLQDRKPARCVHYCCSS